MPLGICFLVAALILSNPLIFRLRPYARLALIGYSALTFILYFVVHPVSMFDWLGIFTKGVELALLTVLVVAATQKSKISALSGHKPIV